MPLQNIILSLESLFCWIIEVNLNVRLLKLKLSDKSIYRWFKGFFCADTGQPSNLIIRYGIYLNSISILLCYFVKFYSLLLFHVKTFWNLRVLNIFFFTIRFFIMVLFPYCIAVQTMMIYLSVSSLWCSFRSALSLQIKYSIGLSGF